MLALKNLQAHANGARKDEIRANRVSRGQRQYPRQPSIHELEDIDDQPNADHAYAQDNGAT